MVSEHIENKEIVLCQYHCLFFEWRKFHLQWVTFFLLFTREKNICLWTLWNFSWPSATRNFKIGFTRKCSSHSWTGEKRSLTVGKIFFTKKRDNYTNKVLFKKVDFSIFQNEISNLILSVNQLSYSHSFLEVSITLLRQIFVEYDVFRKSL